jgi:hypothetical protein
MGWLPKECLVWLFMVPQPTGGVLAVLHIVTPVVFRPSSSPLHWASSWVLVLAFGLLDLWVLHITFLPSLSQDLAGF